MKNLKKFSLSAIALTAIASSAQAAVSMSETGSVSGNIELGTFYGVASVVFVALGAMWAIKAGIRLVK